MASNSRTNEVKKGATIRSGAEEFIVYWDDCKEEFSLERVNGTKRQNKPSQEEGQTARHKTAQASDKKEEGQERTQ